MEKISAESLHKNYNYDEVVAYWNGLDYESYLESYNEWLKICRDCPVLIICSAYVKAMKYYTYRNDEENEANVS